MALPPKHWLDSLDALGGAPKITHPHGRAAYPTIERVFHAPIAEAQRQPVTLADYPGSFLVHLEEISRDNLRVKLYARYDTLASPRIITRTFANDDVNYPIFTSTRTVSRSAWAARSTLAPLDEVTGLTLTAGGTGYTSAPTVSFSGGAGTGAAATAQIMPQSAVLTKQEQQPMEGEYSSLCVREVQVFETLPGPEIATSRYDSETGTNRKTYRQRVAIGTAAKPCAAVGISVISVANPATVTCLSPHGLPTGTFTVHIEGVTGGTAISGNYTATRVSGTAFTIPVNVTSSPTQKKGFVTPLYNGQAIISSMVEPDGTAAGTLVTETVELNGRGMQTPDREDTERRVTVAAWTQLVYAGTDPQTPGATWSEYGESGFVVEKSEVVPEGAAMARMNTELIKLSTAAEFIDPFQDTKRSVPVLKSRKLVAVSEAAVTLGTAHAAPYGNYIAERSENKPNDSVTGWLETDYIDLTNASVIVEKDTDEATGCATAEYTLRVAAGTTPMALGTTISSSIVLETSCPDENSVVGVLTYKFFTFPAPEIVVAFVDEKTGFPMKRVRQFGLITTSGAITALTAKALGSAYPESPYKVISSEPTPRDTLTLWLETICADTASGTTHDARTWWQGGLQLSNTDKAIAPTTTLAGGVNVIAEKIAVLSEAEAKRFTETVLSHSGSTLADGAAIFTIGQRDDARRVTIYTTLMIVTPAWVPLLEGAEFQTTYDGGTGMFSIAANQNSTPEALRTRVLESSAKPIDGSPNYLATVVWSGLPLPRVEYPDVSFDFPGVLTVLNDSWFNFLNTPGEFRHPWMGIDVDYIDPRTIGAHARDVVFYTYGQNQALPPKHKVITNGTGSKAYPFIRGNTIHPAIQYYANGVLIEDIDASSPRSYDAQDVLIANAASTVWRGRFFENRIRQVSERRHVSNFDPVVFAYIFRATASAVLETRIYDYGFPDGAQLLIVSNNAGDTQTLTIQGKRLRTQPGEDESLAIDEETVTLTGTTPVNSSHSWYKLYSLTLSSNAVGTITVRLPGPPAYGTFTITNFPASIPCDVAIEKNGVTRTYTLTFPCRYTLTCDDFASVDNNDEIVLPDPSNSGTTVRYWFRVSGSPTAPTPGAGERVSEIDIAGASTDEDVAAIVATALSADGWQITRAAEVISAQGNLLGERDAGSLTGLGGAWSLSQPDAGTPLAANQVRAYYTDFPLSTAEQVWDDLFSTLTNVTVAIAAGSCSPSTTALPFDAFIERVSAYVIGVSDPDAEPGTVNTWDLTTTSSEITPADPTGAANGQIICTFSTGQSVAYRNVDFYNPRLSPPNVPPKLSALTTDPINVGDYPCYIEVKAGGGEHRAIPVKYQVATTSGGSYSDGAVSIPNLSGGRLYRIVPTDNKPFIRLVFDTSSRNKPVAVHAVVNIVIDT